MARQPVVMDWYWHMMVEWSLADLMLQMNDVSSARIHADRMRERAFGAQEATWRVLALEICARAASEAGDTKAAIETIEEAIALVTRVGAPAVDWRVCRTAEQLHRETGGIARADALGLAGRNAIHRITSGLPLNSRLRETFAKVR